MPDPYQIFAGRPDKHDFLRIGWLDLYQALKGATERAKVERIRPCELMQRHPSDPHNRPPAIGRIRPGGPAACARCLARLTPSTPGGYPLDITDERNRP